MIITFELDFHVTPYMESQLLGRFYSSREEFDRVVENVLDDESEEIGDIYYWASFSKDTYDRLWEWYKQKLIQDVKGQPFTEPRAAGNMHKNLRDFCVFFYLTFLEICDIIILESEGKKMKEFYYVFESETVGTFAVLDSSYENAKETAEEVAADAEYMYDAFEWEIDQAGLDVF